MGTWSTNLFGNDTSCDVRDTYIQHLQNQLSDEEAEAKMMEEYERDFARDEDEQPLFWYALAAAEWKVGRLSEKVKAEALSWIARQGGVELWDAENLLETNPVKAEAQSREKKEKWLSNLAKLEETLNSPQPRRRGFRPPEVLIEDRWNLGDVYAYRLQTQLDPNEKGKRIAIAPNVERYGMVGKYMLLQKVGVGGNSMRICVYRLLLDSIPTDCSILEHAELLPMEAPPMRSKELTMDHTMKLSMTNKEYPDVLLSFIGNAPLPQLFTKGMYAWKHTTENWWRLPMLFPHYYHDWDGLTYEYRDGVPYWNADNDQPLWPSRRAELEEDLRRSIERLQKKR